ncbi:MAG TPA: alternative ribosome rescue aminoacyl-tRNA hydrolase ArfB [Anaerolineae bacterium]|nr:alternative ribosome rescue aminoacyl-tRNA hydrolase ArfB [Anaerolineae bacterium]
MLLITPSLAIDESEIQESFVRASGPGGQNVNKVATAVQLRFDVRHSPSLSEDVKARLLRLAGRRVSADGVITIDARRFRTQEQNRADARERLAELIRRAMEAPKVRRATKPSRAAKGRRLETKRKRSKVKRLRRADREFRG